MKFRLTESKQNTVDILENNGFEVKELGGNRVKVTYYFDNMEEVDVEEHMGEIEFYVHKQPYIDEFEDMLLNILDDDISFSDIDIDVDDYLHYSYRTDEVSGYVIVSCEIELK